MSMYELLIATRDAVRTGIGGTVSNTQFACDLQPNGQPPPNAADIYVGIDESGVASDGNHAALGELATIEITISKQCGFSSPDRLATLYGASKGLEPIERLIIAAVHGNYAIMAAANTAIGGTSPFYQPFWYVGRTRTRIETGDWSGCEPDAKAWLVRVLTFSGCKRMQNLANTLT